MCRSKILYSNLKKARGAAGAAGIFLLQYSTSSCKCLGRHWEGEGPRLQGSPFLTPRQPRAKRPQAILVTRPPCVRIRTEAHKGCSLLQFRGVIPRVCLAGKMLHD